MRRLIPTTLVMLGAAIAFQSGPAALQEPVPVREVTPALQSDQSEALRTMRPGTVVNRPDRQVPNAVKFTPPGRGPKLAINPLLQDWELPTIMLAPTPAPGLSFDGTSDDDNAAVAGGRVVPPDTNGDVGPNHYVQMNNSVFEIFDKQGNMILGPLPNNTLWSGFGGICQANNDGDPIVFHDQLADRWVFSQFAIGSTGHQCFAVSQTPDPTGVYYRYDFVISPGLNGFNDYPKIGTWPDGYYLSANEFGGPSQSFQFPIAVVFERERMLAGDPNARFVRFTVPGSGGSTYFSLQPSHWEGATPPPAGAPNVFTMAYDVAAWGGSGSDGYQLWEFAVNWANPAVSTFTALGRVATAAFDANLCNFSSCAPQPNPGELLDTLSQFTMFRAMYRNLNGTPVLVGTHTVDVGGNRAGVRWFELRKNVTWALHQTGTYAPADGVHRWMGSAAMDEAGNIVLAYSASSTLLNPSIRYTSREAADPLGTLPGGEVDCVAGGGVQTSSANRWGDYAAISVDPVNACTFWLTSEYYANTGTFDFKTRICKVTLTTCGTPTNSPPTVTITAPANGSSHTVGTSTSFAATATDAQDGNLSDALSWISNLDGAIGSGASFSTTTLSVGTHTVAASVTDTGGLVGSSSVTVVVNPGGGTTVGTFVSIDADDGLLVESSESSNAAGLIDSTSATIGALRIGDLDGDLHLKSILSFDTSSIPDGATIVSATLRVRRGQLRGTDPFLTHGAALVDIRQGWFGSSQALEAGDFSAAPSAAGVAALSFPAANGDWSEGTLNPAGLAAVNRTGPTQFRLAFALDDDDDNVADFIGFRSGDDSDPASRPQLLVAYSVGGGGNTAPSVSISAPANGSSFPQGTSIGFSGTATDTQDGSLTSALTWTSNLDGAIGTGGSFARVLSVGTHTVTASVNDSGGLPGSASITVTVQGNAPPTVTITSPANGSTFVQGTSIAFSGTAIDIESGTLTAGLSWTSSLDAAIGTGGSFSAVLSVGTHTVTASVNDGGGLPGAASISVTVSPTGGTTEGTFASIGAQDGLVAESSETSNAGGLVDVTSSNVLALRVGDLNGDQQCLTILSFDTSSIPDGATIVSATVRLRRSALRGSNPFLTHGVASVDIRTGPFGGTVALEPGDFQAAATAAGIAVLSNPAADGDWSEASLNAAGLAAVNRTGVTQLRFAFSLDDDDDSTADFVAFQSGDDANLASRPQLIVVYQP